ncbi:MAG: patatin-like phospholipase family protein [Bacteroidetes bacterium]|jgi:hypothetical protein|nr:patatin-like phospholipase family protein [Bacteroidota bacterium]
MNQKLRDIYYSFPVQLLVLHLRSHLLLLSIWLVFVLLITGTLARRLGFQYLFLDAEYLGQVNFYSFFFVGVGFGSFFMSWNLATYLLSAHYFPFLASLSRPFTKFVINNFLLPLAFLLLYLGISIYFQHYYEGLVFREIFLNTFGFLCGTAFLVVLYALYFQFTNRDISYYIRRQAKPPHLMTRAYTPGRRTVDLEYIKQDTRRWRVHHYLNEAFRPRLVRSVAHYDSGILRSIFKQNHLNALVLQLISMILLLVLGYLIDYPPFRIPAGSSLFILASVLTAVIGAITYWFSEWSVAVFLLMLLGLNFITRFEAFNYTNKAYGLNYDTTRAEYSRERLRQLGASDRIEDDKSHTRDILEKWRERTGEQKPKLVILCSSGGGLKSATWSMQVAQTADRMLEGELMDHTVLITGASGGMLGMAYLRELYLRQALGDSIDVHDKRYIDDITKDLVNSIAFTIVSNDLFIPWSSFEKHGYTYYKDRGYILEQQLNENTNGWLNKTIGTYQQPEAEALIPMLYLTPSIVNDARRLIISPQGVSFMMMAPVGQRYPQAVEVDAVDFRAAFRQQDADNLGFLSALRMNATYPYVLPNVHLPSRPEIEVMDAGFLDNYGIVSATRFTQVFREWILEHTSGVVLVQISSSDKEEEIQPSGGKGIVESILNPLGIAGKVLVKQEFEHDNSLGFMYDLLGEENFEVIRFFYYPTQENKLEASISFHMTAREKADVLNAIHHPENMVGLRRLQALIGKQNTEAAHFDWKKAE